MSTESWISVGEVARHFSVDKYAIGRWIEHKGVGAYKLGCLCVVETSWDSNMTRLEGFGE